MPADFHHGLLAHEGVGAFSAGQGDPASFVGQSETLEEIPDALTEPVAARAFVVHDRLHEVVRHFDDRIGGGGGGPGLRVLGPGFETVSERDYQGVEPL